jgi:aminoglycoside phosphotransferase (APT) family kinase protein
MPSVDESISWLTSPSVEELRRAIGQVLPGLAERPIVLSHRVVTSDPRFFQGRAILDDAYVVKFAWSEPPARRIVHEGRVLAALAKVRDPLPVPHVVAAVATPALLVTQLVPGEPLSWEEANEVSGPRRARLVEDLAGFLAVLHDHATLDGVGNAVVGLRMPEPGAQASTAELRARFGRHVKTSQRPIVYRWCDWVDDVLAEPTDTALLHGDLHGYNLVWDPSSGALRLVADFESAGVGDPAFDFRYLPGQANTVDLFLEVGRRYAQLTARVLNLDRVMAWHIRTMLGDALWRTEASVPLPGSGGTASSWVSELEIRMRAVLGR